MASQLGSAITPTGHQAYGDLLGTEMQQRAMAQNAMQNQQQAALAQQQLAQQQGQFEAGLLEAQRQREHDVGREDIAYRRGMEMMTAQQGFQAAQADALRKWQDQQMMKQQKFQLQLDQLEAMREAAIAKGQRDLAATLSEQILSMGKEQASHAMRLTLANNAVGKTESELRQVASGIEFQLQQKINARQQEQKFGSDFGKNLSTALNEEGRRSGNASYQAFLAQMSGPGSMGLTPFLGADPRGLEDTPGMEWINLSHGGIGGEFSGISGALDPYQTGRAKYVAGEMDPKEMTDIIQNRMKNAIVTQLKNIPNANVRPEEATKLIEMLGGAASEMDIQQQAAKANVSTTTLKAMLNAVADSYDESNPDYALLREREAAARQAAGGEEDIPTIAIRKEIEARRTAGTVARRFAGRLREMDFNQMNAGLDVLKGIRGAKSMQDMLGQIRMAREPLAGIGLGSEIGRLQEQAGTLEGLMDQAKQSAIGQGDLAERQKAMQQLLPLQMMGAQGAAQEDYLKGIGGLIGEMGP